MKQPKIKPGVLRRLVVTKGLTTDRLARLCNVTRRQAQRFMRDGMPSKYAGQVPL